MPVGLGPGAGTKPGRSLQTRIARTNTSSSTSCAFFFFFGGGLLDARLFLRCGWT